MRRSHLSHTPHTTNPISNKPHTPDHTRTHDGAARGPAGACGVVGPPRLCLRSVRLTIRITCVFGRSAFTFEMQELTGANGGPTASSSVGKPSSEIVAVDGRCHAESDVPFSDRGGLLQAQSFLRSAKGERANSVLIECAGSEKITLKWFLDTGCTRELTWEQFIGPTLCVSHNSDHARSRLLPAPADQLPLTDNAETTVRSPTSNTASMVSSPRPGLPLPLAMTTWPQGKPRQCRCDWANSLAARRSAPKRAFSSAGSSSCAKILIYQSKTVIFQSKSSRFNRKSSFHASNFCSLVASTSIHSVMFADWFANSKFIISNTKFNIFFLIFAGLAELCSCSV